MGGVVRAEPEEIRGRAVAPYPALPPCPITRRNIVHPMLRRTARHTHTPATTPMMPIAIGSCMVGEEYHIGAVSTGPSDPALFAGTTTTPSAHE